MYVTVKGRLHWVQVPNMKYFPLHVVLSLGDYLVCFINLADRDNYSGANVHIWGFDAIVYWVQESTHLTIVLLRMTSNMKTFSLIFWSFFSIPSYGISPPKALPTWKYPCSCTLGTAYPLIPWRRQTAWFDVPFGCLHPPNSTLVHFFFTEMAHC